MILLWHIFFSLAAAASLGAATLSGQVELADSREASVSKQKDYSGIVVWLEPLAQPAHPVKPGNFTMMQKSKRFMPHVLVVPVGSNVDFPNSDPIFHNAFSNFSGQPFDTGLYPPGTSQKVRFRREGIVRIFCNIHSNMSAVIVVVNTPYFATTGKDGKFRLDEVAPGEYKLRVWHERAAQKTLDSLQQKIVVDGDRKLSPLRISESGYLEVPHKNKHGQEYPASDRTYTGAPK
jgi:plastocyanin